MNQNDFWALVDRATKNSAAKNDRETAKALTKELLPLPEADIIQWDAILDAYKTLADTSKLVAAAVVINGGTSDDRFIDFRVWLIMQGKAVYETALATPDSLADLELPFDWAEWELCGYAGSYAFTLKQQMQYLSADNPNRKPLLQRYGHRPNFEAEVLQSAINYNMYHRLRPEEWQPDIERKLLDTDVITLLQQYTPERELYQYYPSLTAHRRLVRQLGRDLQIDRQEISTMDALSLPHLWHKRVAWERQEELRESRRLRGEDVR